MAEPFPREAPERRVPIVQLVIGALIVLYVILFIIFNDDEQNLDFVFFDVNAGLWLIIVVSLVLGAILDRLASYLLRRRRARR